MQIENLVKRGFERVVRAEDPTRDFVGFVAVHDTTLGPVLGVLQQGDLRAAANVNPPRPAPAPPSLEQRYLRMCAEIGEAAIARFQAFAAAGAAFVLTGRWQPARSGANQAE